MSDFLSLRRNGKHLVVIAVVVVLATGAWWIISRKTGIGSPNAILKAAAIPIKDSTVVPAGKQMTLKYEVKTGQTPGLLSGAWGARGKSAGIKGANDDTLVGFQLLGPNNEKLQEIDHPTDGNFSVRVQVPGIYTFVFDNAGIIRSSERQVSLDGQYQPD